MKLTNKDFELFKSQCKKWIEVLGLKGWDVVYCFENDPHDPENSDAEAQNIVIIQAEMRH